MLYYRHNKKQRRCNHRKIIKECTHNRKHYESLFGIVLLAQGLMVVYTVVKYITVGGAGWVGLHGEWVDAALYSSMIDPISMLVRCVWLLLALKTWIAIFHVIKEGRPFDATVSKNFRILGGLSLAQCVIDGATQAATTLVNGEAAILGALSSLISAVFFFLLACVFQYGTELQRQADETL